MWYSNSLAQWFDIPTIATPTHDEKGMPLRWPLGQIEWARVQPSPVLGNPPQT